jgi:uncharacterized protein affecting Mg2+/Co2+ transport
MLKADLTLHPDLATFAGMGEDTPKDEAKEEKATFTTIWLPIITAVVGVALGGFITYWFSEYSGRLRTLQYFASSNSGLINTPQVAGKTLQVLLDGKPVKNISAVSISVFNLTDLDYDNVPIEVVFSPVDGKTPSLIQANINTDKETFDVLPVQDQGDNTLRFRYRIHLMNRSNLAALNATYFFDGDQAPTMELKVDYKGLIAKQVEIPKSELYTLSNSAFISAGVGIVTGVFLFWYQIRRSNRKRGDFFGYLVELEGISQHDKSKLIERYAHSF